MDSNRRDLSTIFGCVRKKLAGKPARVRVQQSDSQTDDYLQEVTSATYSPGITSVNSTTNFCNTDHNARRSKLKKNTLDKRLKNLQQTYSNEPNNSSSGLLPSEPASLRAAPRDRYNLIYFSLILSGSAFLVPYNSFVIGGVDYFQERYPNTTIIFDLSSIYIITQFIAVIINNLLISLISFKVRICFGYFLSIAVLLVVSVFEIGYDLFAIDNGYQLNLFAIAIVSFGCTVQQSSFYGCSSMLPKEYTQALMVGESMSGLFVSISRILTKLLIRDEQLNTLIFFLISTAILVLCLFLNYFIKDDEFIRYHVNHARKENSNLESCLFMASSSPRNSMQENNNIELVVKLNQTGTTDSVPKSDSTEFDNLPFGIDEEELVFYVQQPNNGEAKTTNCLGSYCKRSSSQTELETNLIGDAQHRSNLEHLVESNLQSQRLKRASSSEQKITTFLGNYLIFLIYFKQHFREGLEERLKVVRVIYPLMISICLTYLLTLSLFPGVESVIENCSLRSWTPVILFLVFNLTDVTGKYLTKFLFSIGNHRIVFYTSLRFLLLPCFILCLVPNEEPVFTNFAFILLFTVALGLTNGIFGSLPMIVAPNYVANKELTGNLMTLSYCVGLTLGTLLSYLIENLFFDIKNHSYSLCLRDASHD